MQAPCGHNFCLGCFNKWVAQGKKSCPTCRAALPAKFSANPRINTALAGAIRLAKLGDKPAAAQTIEVSTCFDWLIVLRYVSTDTDSLSWCSA